MKNFKPLVVCITCVVLEATTALHPHTLNSANLSNTKDTLQSSRISFAGRVASPTAAGQSQVTIDTSTAVGFGSTSTNNLHIGDSVMIGTGTTNTYTVVDVQTSSSFTVTPVLASGDADVGDAIYLRARPQQVVTFNTASAIANGFFQVLIPAASSNFNDGLPDQTGFDFGGGSITVSAADVGNYDFSPTYTVATVSGGTYCTSPANYHCFEFHYSGNGGVGTAINLVIGNTNGSNTPIAPAPSSGHVIATGDNYTIIVKNFANQANPSTATPIDQTSGRVAVIEPVRLTANVDPTITFTIGGVGTGTSACGALPDIDTSTGTNAPLAVPFGVMPLNTFRSAAQLLTVSTNAGSGYAVTTIENDQMGENGGTAPFIPDTTCDGGTCTHLVGVGWTAATNNGLGYAIENVSATGVDPTNSYTGYATGFRQFPASIESESPVQIMYGSTVANAQQVRVCYKLSVGATQAAGYYENQVIYTATATF